MEIARLVDGLEARGLRNDTLIFLIWGDNGPSAEGSGDRSASCSPGTTSGTTSPTPCHGDWRCSTVSQAWFDRRPFEFEGTSGGMKVRLGE